MHGGSNYDPLRAAKCVVVQIEKDFSKSIRVRTRKGTTPA